MKHDLSVTLCGIKLKNPIITASGTCGYGKELAQFYDLSALGAFTAKSITLEKRAGNPNPRIAECVSGILNSIGIQSQGVRHFIEQDLPFLRQFEVPVIVSISGNYVMIMQELQPSSTGRRISAIEVNISLPEP
jgi:dihydroorotate dehydrogenase (NAD+) catalytic subunit